MVKDCDNLKAQKAKVPPLKPQDERLVVALATRSYHLPGFTYGEDLCQYLRNNHPLLGIFCHHELHPITTKMRILALLGSVLCGLTISNIFFLLVLKEEKFQVEVISVRINGTNWSITTGLLLLWTLGGAIHATYDIWIWYIAACACCPFSKKWRQYGASTTIFLFVMLLTMSSFVVLVRACLDREENLEVDVLDLESAGIADDQITLSDIEPHDLRFLLGYTMEFMLALLVYYPIGSVTLFSGVLGCGRLPVLGGRPRDIWIENINLQRDHNLIEI